MKSFFFPTIRGRLAYPTLRRFVNDVAEAANINKPLPGGKRSTITTGGTSHYFVQDEWRVEAVTDAQPRASATSSGQQHPEPDRAQRPASWRRTTTIRSMR